MIRPHSFNKVAPTSVVMQQMSASQKPELSNDKQPH